MDAIKKLRQMFPLRVERIMRGCDAPGDVESLYMTRLTLFQGANKGVKLCIHIFHRSDFDDLHDHPWNFWSLILWRGYNEIAEVGSQRVWPGQMIRRKADWRHRVQLLRENGREKKAITLVWMG